MRTTWLGLGSPRVDIDRLAKLPVQHGGRTQSLREAAGDKVIDVLRTHPEGSAYWDTLCYFKNWRRDEGFVGKPWTAKEGTNYGSLQVSLMKDHMYLSMEHFRDTNPAKVLARLNMVALETRVAGYTNFSIDVVQSPASEGDFGTTRIFKLPLTDAGFEFLRQMLNRQHQYERFEDRRPLAAIREYQAGMTDRLSTKALTLPL